MARTKTSKKPADSSKKLKIKDFEGARRIHPTFELADPSETALSVFECLMNNDPDGAMEMIHIYLAAINKSKLLRESNLPKSTLYSAYKHRNPTIKTLAKIMSAAA